MASQSCLNRSLAAPEGMSANAFAIASNELRERFIRLLDSLSTIRALTGLDVHQQDELALLDEALTVLIRHQGPERCAVFLLHGETLVQVAGREYSDTFGDEMPGAELEASAASPEVPLGEGLVGLAAETRELQWCEDCSRDPRMRAADDASPADRGCMMSAPLMSGDDVLGVVALYHEQPHFFQDWHRHVLVAFCNILALMLANSRAMRHLEQLVAVRTRQLESALVEAEQMEQRYRQLSIVDELTGLHNRRYFFDQAESALAHCIRHGRPFSVVLLDIDFFKRINDTYGHAVGDTVLRDLSKVLQRQVRLDDTLARFGGEEFVLSLPDTDLAGARTLANRIRQHVLEMEWQFVGERFGISVSLGIALAASPVKGQSREVLTILLQEADEALYFSKENGRNQVNAHSELPISGRMACGS